GARVVGQALTFDGSVGINFFALLPVAAADRAFFLDPQVGDAAAGPGEGFAAGDHANGHAQHDQQQNGECHEPGHGCSPCVGNNASNAVVLRLTKPLPSRVTNSAAMFSASANARPCSGPRTINTVDKPSACMAELSNTVTAASLWFIGAARRGSRVCE